MKPKLPLLAVIAGAVLALTTLLSATDTVHAGTFDPELKITVDNPEPDANSEYIVDFNLPKGDVNFAGVVAFIPKDWGVVPGNEIPIGAVVGKLRAQATLGIINGACDNVLPVDFVFLNASVDPSDTVSYLDTDDEGEDGFDLEDVFEDKDKSGLQDAFEKYPDYITRVLVDENDQPLQPIRRAAGITIVAGANILLQFLVFEPGTFIDEDIPNDEALGYPTVTLLQNAGDPDADPVPGPITDFCTPLITRNTSFAISKDNPCTDDVPVPLEIPDEGTSTPDESGLVLFTNPQDGTYTFTIIAVGQRDADGDGYENLLDTCPFDPNQGDPRIKGDGDEDSDGLDAACDPNDDRLAGGINSDEDLDGYTNRQDNCTLEPNGEEQDNQRDTDNDGIGDACDPNPNDPDTEGVQPLVVVTQDVIIGTGQGEGGPPSGFESGGGDGDGDGGSNTIIIIIIAVIAAVVVVGGGAFLLMRRGSGGGGATA